MADAGISGDASGLRNIPDQHARHGEGCTDKQCQQEARHGPVHQYIIIARVRPASRSAARATAGSPPYGVITAHDLPGQG